MIPSRALDRFARFVPDDARLFAERADSGQLAPEVRAKAGGQVSEGAPLYGDDQLVVLAPRQRETLRILIALLCRRSRGIRNRNRIEYRTASAGRAQPIEVGRETVRTIHDRVNVSACRKEAPFAASGRWPAKGPQRRL